MKRAEYPARSCREPLFGDEGQADTCAVVLGHPGPCAAYGIPDSVKRRDEWEESHPGWEADVGTKDIIF